MKIRILPLAALLAALFTLSVPAPAIPAPTTPTLQGDAAHPDAAHWVRSELYFGLGATDVSDGGVAEIRWRSFLDREVTPRFPDGLSVFEAYGQWRGRSEKAPSRLRSKVLVIFHEDTPANRAAVDAIRVAWKAATHDKSVLLVTEPVEVSF
jgi:hypothetical protein